MSATRLADKSDLAQGRVEFDAASHNVANAVRLVDDLRELAGSSAARKTSRQKTAPKQTAKAFPSEIELSAFAAICDELRQHWISNENAVAKNQGRLLLARSNGDIDATPSQFEAFGETFDSAHDAALWLARAALHVVGWAPADDTRDAVSQIKDNWPSISSALRAIPDFDREGIVKAIAMERSFGMVPVVDPPPTAWDFNDPVCVRFKNFDPLPITGLPRALLVKFVTTKNSVLTVDDLEPAWGKNAVHEPDAVRAQVSLLRKALLPIAEELEAGDPIPYQRGAKGWAFALPKS